MRYVALALCAVLASAGVNAATLTLDEGIKFWVVNGKEQRAKRIQRHETITLVPGENQIVIRYDDEVKDGSKTRVFTSKPYAFLLNVVEGDEITLLLPQRLRTLSQAKAFFRDPQWLLQYQQDEPQAIETQRIEGNGLGAYSDPEAVVAAYNQTQGIVIDDEQLFDYKKDAVTISDEGEIELSDNAVAQLKMWYTRASDKEKVAFKVWLAQQ
ncbi:DUF2057 family protein [Thaumasiovibrio sp. DFM-14]|uniref:YccT family protein n=1 Tax=Thaumasiovibrio sp. DFM-14 TaxID=3384792 RepID=UPI0039A02F9C